MPVVVSALFKDRFAVEHAVRLLQELGFEQDDVSVLMSDATMGREFGEFAVVKHSKVGEGAAAGAATGGVLGAIVAALAAVASIAIPGIGLLATGPLVAALAGAGAGGAAGTFVGALVGAGIPEHEAKLLGPGVERGGILVGVHVSERPDVARVKAALKEAGGRASTTTSVSDAEPLHR